MKYHNHPKDDSLIVDISDALSERDRVRFTVHTRTKLPQFSKQVLSVVRQHEEFIWLHDCLCENDQYAGYIIPPQPPKPDFDASREKLQRLGDCEANLTKDEFAKMKQELEAEYLAIFKKTVAMHEIFLQRLAAHEKFREDNNFKIFLEYENELAVRGKSKREKIAGSIQNIGKSLTDFVITTSQVANSSSISNITGSIGGSNISAGQINEQNYNPALNISRSNNSASSYNSANTIESMDKTNGNNNVFSKADDISSTSTDVINGSDVVIDEQYFEKERLFLALYYNSIRESAICADRVMQARKCVADSYLHIAQQLVKLASIEVVPITSQTVDSSSFVSCPLPSLTLPAPARIDIVKSHEIQNKTFQNDSTSSSLTEKRLELLNDDRRELNDDQLGGRPSSSTSFGSSSFNLHNNTYDNKHGDNLLSGSANTRDKSTGGCATELTSEGLKKLLLNVSDYLEQARKIETRIASDEDLKLTDTLLYYKRDTVAAQELLMRRLRFMSEYENATKNLDKARLKGRTAMQYADVIQKQAKENFMSISKLAKQELLEYKIRRVASFKKAFTEMAELEIKHLKSQSQLIVNCLNSCRGLSPSEPVASTSHQRPQTSK